MTSIANSAVLIQTSSVSIPAPPSWFGEVVFMAAHLRKHGVLTKIQEGVRFARRRFGPYEVIDFLAVLFGYAVSSERTLEAFYERLQPFAGPFMALFGRDQLPARSTLSRFLAALTAEPIDALRTLFREDLESRPLSPDNLTGGLVDRTGNAWVVFDADGTREAARQRALPQTEALPAAFRRLDDVCAPGYTGRKRGQVVRTRTVVSQAHTYQWLGTFGNRGNGSYRVELRKALVAISGYLTANQLPKERTLLRLDGQYGTLRCPAKQTLSVHERRQEADGSLRLVYGASIRRCRPCPLREQCQWNGAVTAKPRQVSVLLHPLPLGAAPLLWRYSRRRAHRRACKQLVRHQHLEMSLSPPAAASPPIAEVILSRAQRARYRLSWQERLARNARVSTTGPVTIKLFGVPTAFAASLGLATA